VTHQVSHYTSNVLLVYGIANTSAVVNLLFISSKQASHSFIHENG